MIRKLLVCAGLALVCSCASCSPGSSGGDDIRAPSDDLTDITLFKRYEGNPILRYEGENNWRDSHIANVAVLGPGESPDGVNWFLYARGSGHTGTSGDRTEDYHDQIGLFTQSAASFKPFGPWDEYPSNPIIKHGTAGEYDARHLLDCAPVVGAGGDVYFYYLGKSSYTSPGVYAGQRSTDGGYTFTKFAQPVIDDTGCSDAIYHDRKYYLFTGGARFDGRLNLHLFITADPESTVGAEHHRVLDVGGGPANFDSYSVNGARIFRLAGVDKWFMVYQGSATHFDFPDRFHVAYSEDLINWTKVVNDVPLFTRGKAGTWDQGAIWYGEIFEHGDMLYLYYEAWGCEQEVENRDEPYFAWGHSQTGGASASKAEFLEWCGF